MYDSYKYWIRTAAGLEKIFLRELASRFTVGPQETRHRSVFFELEQHIPANQLCGSFRTADDIYYFLGKETGISNTRQSVQKITRYFASDVLPHIPQAQPVRVTASFLGQRNFNRFYIENAVNDILAARLNPAILFNEKGDTWTEGECRVRIHIEDEEAYFGIGLQDKPLHRRPWRGESYNAQLHPPLAAAMALIAAPEPGTQVIDPFCGSGTILIESALQHGQVSHTGFDIDAEAVRIAKQNALQAGVSVEFVQEDFIHHYKNYIGHTLITNPPWGEKHSIDGKNFIGNLRTLIMNSKSAVMLVPEDQKNALTAAGITMHDICTTRVRGKLATVVQITAAS